MPKLRAFVLRLRGLFSARRANDDFAAELESHIALHTDEGIRAGLTPAEARRQALLRLGGAEQTRQAHRERRTLPWLESLFQDTRYGLRTLRRSPGFTLTAVLTLALGIGACTAVFSLVDAVLIRSLPYGDPQRLVYLFTPSPTLHLPAEVVCPGYGDFLDIKRDNHSYANMTAFEQITFSLADQRSSQRIGAAKVDPHFFATLQSTPVLGRVIDADDNQPGRNKVAVIAYSLWQSLFAGSPDVLNRSIDLDGTSYQIVGVMPPAFGYPFASDLPYGDAHIQSTRIWVPLALTPKQKAEHDINNDVVLARLLPGVSIREAQSEMSTMMARLDKLHPGSMNDWGALIEGFLSISVGPVRPLLLLLLGSVCIVLLIACGNAASLLLARSSSRMRELGVRVALGAGRARIARQLITESLLIGVFAGAIGVALAFAFLHLLPRLDPGNIPRLREASLDTRVLLFTVGVSILSSLLTGILPAITISRTNPTDFLAASGGRSVLGGSTKMQSALIVLESALVIVLLAGAGLLIRSYVNVESVPVGFAQTTVTADLQFDRRYSQSPQRSAFIQTLLARIQALPGVQAAGAVNHLPLSKTESIGFVRVDGYPNQKDQMAEGRTVTRGYFSAMQIPLVAGRLFTDADKTASQNFAIVNQTFAQKYFAGRSPLGGKISGDDPDATSSRISWRTVIGVVADVHHTSLEEATTPQIYTLNDVDGGFIAVRSTLPATAVAGEMRTALKAIDPNFAVGDIRTMGDYVSDANARRRFQTSLLTVFAAIALLLAMVGLYGLMAYSVSRRTREVGIRMALGAQRNDVLLLIVKKAALLLSIGLAAGLVGTWFATRAIQLFLFGVSPHDPITIATVCAVLGVCGLAAALIPARRAASINPVQALRSE